MKSFKTTYNLSLCLVSNMWTQVQLLQPVLVQRWKRPPLFPGDTKTSNSSQARSLRKKRVSDFMYSRGGSDLYVLISPF